MIAREGSEGKESGREERYDTRVIQRIRLHPPLPSSAVSPSISVIPNTCVGR